MTFSKIFTLNRVPPLFLVRIMDHSHLLRMIPFPGIYAFCIHCMYNNALLHLCIYIYISTVGVFKIFRLCSADQVRLYNEINFEI